MVKPPVKETEWPEAAKTALSTGQKIEAIKILRETYGIGLKEAKDMVDSLPEGLRVSEMGSESPAIFRNTGLRHYLTPLLLLLGAMSMAWQATGFMMAKSTDSYCLTTHKGTYLLCRLLPQWAEEILGIGTGYIGSALMLYLLATVMLLLAWLSYRKLNPSSI